MGRLDLPDPRRDEDDGGEPEEWQEWEEIAWEEWRYPRVGEEES